MLWDRLIQSGIFRSLPVFALLSCNQLPAQPVGSTAQLTPSGEPGKPFTLTIQILNLNTGKPVPGVEVYAWHTNYKGDYEEDAKGIARIHGTAVSDPEGMVKLVTIYPKGYNDSPTGEHIHFRIKGKGILQSAGDLMFSDYYQKRYQLSNPVAYRCYLQSLEEKDGRLTGDALLYVKAVPE